MTTSLRPVPADAARWIPPRLGAPQTVGSLMPSGFDSYIRLFYPVEIPWPGSGTTTWQKFTEQIGYDLRIETAWQDIEDDDGYTDDLGEPVSGTIPEEMVAGLTDVLRDAAGPGANYFAMMWFGYGDVPAANSNTFVVSLEREMRILTGDLLTAPSEESDRIPVNWWPDNHAWYVGGDLYGRSLYVGGSIAVTTQLLARFEGVSVSLETPIHFEP